MTRTEQRTDTIVKLFLAGRTMPAIGRRFHISRQRVHQILTQAGYHFWHGGRYLATAWKAAEQIAAINARYIRKWGHTRAEHRRIGPAARLRYSTEKRQAIYRGEDWNLNFADWCAQNHIEAGFDAT